MKKPSFCTHPTPARRDALVTGQGRSENAAGERRALARRVRAGENIGFCNIRRPL